jgi:hypothetical protein
VEERILQLIDREGRWIWYTEDRKDTHGHQRTLTHRSA